MAGDMEAIAPYPDIDSGKVLNKEGLLSLCSLIKTEIANNSGGGASYTAGRGIEIGANDVISSYPLDNTTGLLMALLGKDYSAIGFTENYQSLYNGATKDDFITGIKNGRAIEIGANFYWSGLGTDLKDLGFKKVLTIAENGRLTAVDLTQSAQANWRPSRYYAYWACSRIIISVNAPMSGAMGKGISNNLYYNNSTSGLSASTIKGAIDELTTKTLPAAPTTDGTYTLQCVVSSGTPTYSWVAV